MNKQLSIVVSTEGIIGSSDEEMLRVLKKKKKVLMKDYKSWGTSTEDWRQALKIIRRYKVLKTRSEDQSTEEQLLMYHSSVVVVHIRRLSKSEVTSSEENFWWDVH